jgi:hypothetical protein
MSAISQLEGQAVELRSLRRQVEAQGRDLAVVMGLLNAALPLLSGDDRALLALLLPLLPVERAMLATEILSRACAAVAQGCPNPTQATNLADLLARLVDSDKGCRLLGHFLKRCRGRLVGDRYIEVLATQKAGLLYLVRRVGF